MLDYIIRRLLISVPLVLLMTFLVYAVINLKPTTALDKFIMNENISPQLIEQEKERSGYYDSLPIRYLKWLGGVFGDLRFGRERRVLVRFINDAKFSETYQAEAIFEPDFKMGKLSADAPFFDVRKALDGAGQPYSKVGGQLLEFRFNAKCLKDTPSTVTAHFETPGASQYAPKMTGRALRKGVAPLDVLAAMKEAGFPYRQLRPHAQGFVMLVQESTDGIATVKVAITAPATKAEGTGADQKETPEAKTFTKTMVVKQDTTRMVDRKSADEGIERLIITREELAAAGVDIAKVSAFTVALADGPDVTLKKLLVDSDGKPVTYDLALEVPADEMVPVDEAKPEGEKKPAGNTTTLAVSKVMLEQQMISIDKLSAFTLKVTQGGPVEFTGAVVRIDAANVRNSDPKLKQRPYMELNFTGKDQRLVIGQVENPYTHTRIEAGDWLPQGKEIGKDDNDMPIYEQMKFRSIDLSVGNLQTGESTFDLVVHSGVGDKAKTCSIPVAIPGRQRRDIEIPLAELAGQGVDLEHVGAIEIKSRGPEQYYLYRMALVLDQSPMRAGWWPNFGRSYTDNLPVLSKLFRRVNNTVWLLLVATLITWTVAMPAGIIAALRQYHLSDKVLSFLSFVGMALPGFFLAVLVRYVAQMGSDPNSWLSFLPDLPDSGRTSAHSDDLGITRWAQWVDVIKHCILPVVVLSLGGMAGMQRVMRATMLEAKNMAYITTARSKGLPERTVILKHALRNAITPFVAGFGGFFGIILGGSALIEKVFNFPGTGKLMIEATMEADLNLVMAVTLISALLLVLGNLVADILLAVVDPRVSYE